MLLQHVWACCCSLLLLLLLLVMREAVMSKADIDATGFRLHVALLRFLHHLRSLNVPYAAV